MRTAKAFLVGLSLTMAPLRAQCQTPVPTRDDLLRAVVAMTTARQRPGVIIHWAETQDSVVARFATCRPYKSGTACVLNDSIPTFSFEITMVRPGSATVTLRRYSMRYVKCASVTVAGPVTLDPPIIDGPYDREYWVVRNGVWTPSPWATGAVC